MLDNFPGDEDKTRRSRNVVLQKDTENSMDWAIKQQGSRKVNDHCKKTYTQDQEKIAEIHWTFNEEEELRKLNSHGVY